MKDKRIKVIAMAQWVNHLWNNIFVNLCETTPSGTGSYGTLGGRQTKYRLILKFSKLVVGQNIRLVASFNQGTASLQPYQCIPVVFSGTAYCKVGF